MFMKPQEVIWDNLKALMVYRYGEENLYRVNKDGGIPLGTLARIKTCEADIRISTIEKIAELFGLMPWQLMVPNLDPSNPPVFAITEVERRFYDKAKRLREVAQEIVDQ